MEVTPDSMENFGLMNTVISVCRLYCNYRGDIYPWVLTQTSLHLSLKSIYLVLIQIKFYFYGHTTGNTLTPINATPKIPPNSIEEHKLVNFKIVAILEHQWRPFFGVLVKRGGRGIQ